MMEIDERNQCVVGGMATPAGLPHWPKSRDCDCQPVACSTRHINGLRAGLSNLSRLHFVGFRDDRKRAA